MRGRVGGGERHQAVLELGGDVEDVLVVRLLELQADARGEADDVRRRFILPLWNIYAFFVTYAALDGFTPEPLRDHQVALAVLRGQPSVLDRWIQQAVLQVLTPLFDPHFSAHSFGFRPGRSAHQAVEAARQSIVDGAAPG